MNKELRNFLKGMAFLSPWIIGFVLFMALPIILSFYYSMTDYRMLQKPVIIGWLNYKNLAHDEVFAKVLANTLWYAAMALPAGLIVSLGLALLLNVSIPGQAVFRTIIFLPSLVPAAASAMVWMFLLNAKLGIVNNMADRLGIGVILVLLLTFLCSAGVVLVSFLQGRKPSMASKVTMYILAGLIGIELILELLNFAHIGRLGLVHWGVASPAWLEIKWVLRSFAIMSVWGVGNTVVIYLAGLQDVPKELYEAAEIDGASTLRRLWHVTIPMLSPVIFFNLIMAIIGTLQNFTGPQLITQGGPDNASRFFSMYVYDYSFTFLKMGYASAMAWIQLLLVLALTALAFWSSKRWVHYQGK